MNLQWKSSIFYIITTGAKPVLGLKCMIDTIYKERGPKTGLAPVIITYNVTRDFGNERGDKVSFLLYEIDLFSKVLHVITSIHKWLAIVYPNDFLEFTRKLKWRPSDCTSNI